MWTRYDMWQALGPGVRRTCGHSRLHGQANTSWQAHSKFHSIENVGMAWSSEVSHQNGAAHRQC